MKQTIRSVTPLLALLFILAGSLQSAAQQVPGSAPGSAFQKEHQQEFKGLQPFHTPAELQDDETKFATTIFTFGEMVIFSYSNDTEITILNASGDTIQTKMLQKDDYHVEIAPQGIYRIFGSKSFTALIGDATTNIVHGWYAVDQSGRGTSTLFNTYMMRSWTGDEKFIIAAYEDETSFTVKDLDTGSILHAGVLQAGEHHTMTNTPFDKFLQVSASRPVSALSYGDTDYYVPASNGTFAGTMFLGYSAYIGSWTNSITVTGYHDSTDVTVTNTVTGDTISAYILNEGEVHSDPISSQVYWKVEASLPVVAANIPFAGWTGNYMYMTRAIDKTGIGSGKLFYMPTIGSRIDVFSFEEDNEVSIYRLGQDDEYPYTDTLLVFEDNLNAGEGYNFSSTSGRYVYKIEGSGNLSVIQSNGGAGAEFMPLDFAQELPDLAVSSTDIAFDPEKENYDQGEEITVTITVHNFGPVDVTDARVHIYDGDPDGGGSTPLLSDQLIPFIEAQGSETVSFNHIVPDDPEFRMLVVKVDPDDEIRESNSANNKASRPIVPNEDLLPPLAVVVTATGGLGLDENDELEPNPFTVEADILNTGTVAAEDVEINLELFNGLTLETGVPDTTITVLDAGEQIKVIWEISATIDVPGVNRYQIHVKAGNAEPKDVNRAISISNPIPPATPAGFSAALMESELGILLEWEPNEERDLAGYEIQFGTEEGVYDGSTATELISPVKITSAQKLELTGVEPHTDYYIILNAYNATGRVSEPTDEILITTAGDPTSAGPEDVPVAFNLYQNYPNPFNPNTQIKYSLEEARDVHLAVYNMLGRQVKVLVSEWKPAGVHEVNFDASELASGVYFYRLRTGDFVMTRNLTLIK